MGILHFGPVENPSGSGHWIVAVGVTKDRENLIVHDPFGDLDVYKAVYIRPSAVHLESIRKRFK